MRAAPTDERAWKEYPATNAQVLLSCMNDEGKTFAEIADWIETYL